MAVHVALYTGCVHILKQTVWQNDLLRVVKLTIHKSRRESFMHVCMHVVNIYLWKRYTLLPIF